MKRLTAFGVCGAAGVILAIPVSSLVGGGSIYESAENVVVPFGMFVAFAIYSAIDRRGLHWAMAIALPTLLAATALKVLIWPIEDVSFWFYVLSLGGVTGILIGCGLPLLQRLQRDS